MEKPACPFAIRLFLYAVASFIGGYGVALFRAGAWGLAWVALVVAFILVSVVGASHKPPPTEEPH